MKKTNYIFLLAFFCLLFIPVRHAAGLTFGYASAGGSNFPIAYKEYGTYCVRAGSEASPASSGTLDNIKAYLKVDSGESIRFWGIVNQEDSIGADSHGEIAKAENTVTRTAYTTPETFTLGSQSITASTSYILNVYGNANDVTANLKYSYVAYDTTGAVGYYEDTYTTYTVANPWNISDYGTVFKYSIYATYTAAAAAAVEDPPSIIITD